MSFREVSKTGKPSKESEDFAKLTALLKQALNGCLAEVWRQRSQDCQNWLNEVYNINGVTGCWVWQLRSFKLGNSKLDIFLAKHEHSEIILNVTKNIKNPLFSFSQNYI